MAGKLAITPVGAPADGVERRRACSVGRCSGVQTMTAFTMPTSLMVNIQP
jgi:hypothetical protein